MYIDFSGILKNLFRFNFKINSIFGNILKKDTQFFFNIIKNNASQAIKI